MKKYALIVTVFLMFISIVGCRTQTTTNTEKETNKEQPVQKKAEDKKKYNIDKIVVPIQTNFSDDIKVYHDFNIAVIKEMAKSNNIPVETREFTTFNDVHIALKRGDVDVMPGIDKLANSETDLTMTFTYFTGTLYDSIGAEVAPESSYSMLVRADDKELVHFFDDMILSFNESGKMEEIQKKYLGNRN